MKYISTRGNAPLSTFRKLITEGTAPGGGLYMPVMWPQLNVDDLRSMSYPALAAHVLHLFAPEIPPDVVRELTLAAYNAVNFGSPKIVPIKHLNGQIKVAQLSEGPTGAFKDLAMQLIARLINWELEQRDEYRTIVVATSGDTGGAAIEAFKNLPRIKIIVLWPHGRVSTIQQMQMTRVRASNVCSVAVEGTFDDCQRIVKEMFDDMALTQQYQLAGVNSLNWGRLVAQITYWVWIHLRTTEPGEQVNIAIPTGNFGNAFSAYAAWRIGVPFSRIIVATNENAIVARTLQTGTYGPVAKVEPTTSPSMDILVASNFERLCYELFGRDSTRVCDFFEQMKMHGRADLGIAPDMLGVASHMIAGSANMHDVADVIEGIHERFGYVLDPHTAVAMHVGIESPAIRNSKHTLVVAETAKPWKFPETIQKILGVTPELPVRMRELMDAPEQYTTLSAETDAVKALVKAMGFSR